MLVTFKTITQQQFQLELEEGITIGDVKKKIAEEKGTQDFAPESQKLIYNGKILTDEQQLKDVDYAAAKFIVVMVSRKKPEAQAAPAADATPAATTTSSFAGLPPLLPVDGLSSHPYYHYEHAAGQHHRCAGCCCGAASCCSRAVQLLTYSLVVPAEHEATLEAITSMGYPREEAIRALRAAFFNADRAVEYLCTGIPQGMNLDAGAPVAQEEEGEDEEADAATLEFLRNNPLFEQLRELVRTNPEMLPQIMQQIAQTNPDLMEAIRDNQDAFIQMLNDEAPGAIGGGGGGGGGGAAALGEAPAPAAGGAAPGGGRVVTINVTENDREAINRLKAMGFPEQLVIEAYFACDKNEDLAVNYILSRMDEFNEEATGGAAGGGQ
ncbi:UV excision repair protein Rad23 containing protein [Aphelenchoides avenae]|nr:UV excision repair protein Rad23 containing protein [Aphelenchus avenae]